MHQAKSFLLQLFTLEFPLSPDSVVYLKSDNGRESANKVSEARYLSPKSELAL